MVDYEAPFGANNILSINYKDSINNKVHFNILNLSDSPVNNITFCLAFPKKNENKQFEVSFKIKRLEKNVICALEIIEKIFITIKNVHTFEVKWYSYRNKDGDRLLIFPKKQKSLIQINGNKLNTVSVDFNDYFKLTIPFGHSKIVGYNLLISDIKKDFKINKMYLYYYSKNSLTPVTMRVDFSIINISKDKRTELPFRLKHLKKKGLRPAAVILQGIDTGNKKEIILFKNFKSEILRSIPYSEEALKQLIDSINYVPKAITSNSSLDRYKAETNSNNKKVTDKPLKINTQFLQIVSEIKGSNIFLYFKYKLNRKINLKDKRKDIESIALKYTLVSFNYYNKKKYSSIKKSYSFDKSLFEKTPCEFVLKQQIPNGTISKDNFFYTIPDTLVINYSDESAIKIKISQKVKYKQLTLEKAYREQMTLLKNLESIPIRPKNITHNKRILEYNLSSLQILNSSNNHVTKHHDIYETLVSIKYVDKNYEVKNKLIPAYWCQKCYTYFTFEESFRQQINNSNIPFYTISTPLYDEKNKPWKDEIDFKKESILSYYGYTVGNTHGKSKIARHKILETLIRNNILSSDQIINHLEHLIRYNGKRKNMTVAVQDWKEDINYINNMMLKKLSI